MLSRDSATFCNKDYASSSQMHRRIENLQKRAEMLKFGLPAMQKFLFTKVIKLQILTWKNGTNNQIKGGHQLLYMLALSSQLYWCCSVDRGSPGLERKSMQVFLLQCGNDGLTVWYQGYLQADFGPHKFGFLLLGENCGDYSTQRPRTRMIFLISLSDKSLVQL